MPSFAPETDRRGRDLQPGDRVRFKLYPRGTAEGRIVVSPRVRVVMPDGSTLPALAIEMDDRAIYGLSSRGTTKISETKETSMGFKYAVREEIDHVTTLPEIVANAQQEGATHVIVNSIGDAWIYFPIAGGKYEECRASKQNGRWHVDGSGQRDVVDRIQRSATPIEKYLARVGGGRVTEQRTVRDSQGMSIGFMEAYVYAGDIYCEDCGRMMRKELGKKDSSGDSENYPQGPYPDGGGESDSPQHCGSHTGCINTMEFAGTKVGVWLGNPLTNEGVGELKAMLSNPRPSAYQLALHEFWSDVYVDYLGEGWETLEMQLPLPGVREPGQAPRHLVINNWYYHKSSVAFGSLNEYFHPVSLQKNEKLAGVLITTDPHRPRAKPHAVKTSWDSKNNGWWTDIAGSEVPAAVRQVAQSKGMSEHTVRDYEGMSYAEWLATARSNSTGITDDSIAKRAFANGVDPLEFVELYGGFALEESTVREMNFQQGERLRIRVKGPEGQPMEAFWYTVNNTMSLNEVALQFAQTAQPGMLIDVVSGKLKWTFRVEHHAGQPSVTRVRGTYAKEARR